MLHELLVYVRALSVFFLLCIFDPRTRILLIATNLPVTFRKIPYHNNWYLELTPTILYAVLSAKENAQKFEQYVSEVN